MTLDFVIKEFNSQNTFYIFKFFAEFPPLGEACPDHCIKLHLSIGSFVPTKGGKGRGYSEKYKLGRVVPEAQNLMCT